MRYKVRVWGGDVAAFAFQLASKNVSACFDIQAHKIAGVPVSRQRLRGGGGGGGGGGFL